MQKLLPFLAIVALAVAHSAALAQTQAAKPAASAPAAAASAAKPAPAAAKPAAGASKPAEPKKEKKGGC